MGDFLAAHRDGELPNAVTRATTLVVQVRLGNRCTEKQPLRHATSFVAGQFIYLFLIMVATV
jgi:hypothetical protein